MRKRKIEPSYLKYLFEYKVHNPKGYLEEDEENIDKFSQVEYVPDEETPKDEGLDDVQDDSQQTEEEPQNDEAEVTQDEVEEVEESESDIERVKKIQDIQTEKIESSEDKLNQVSDTVNQIADKLSFFDVMNDKIELLYKQVKELTPPTPQESLHKQVDLIGGYTPEEYFQEYEKEHKPIKQYKQYTDSEIKDSLFKI